MPVPYFEGADFKPDIGFQKFWAQIPKFGHFESKSINFLFLAKFRMSPISKCTDFKSDICFRKFWAQFPKLSILEQKGLTFWTLRHFPSTLFRRCWFQTWHLFSAVLSSLVPSLHKQIQCLRYATYLEKVFSFFSKSLKIFWPQFSFYCKYGIKKNLSIF